MCLLATSVFDVSLWLLVAIQSEMIGERLQKALAVIILHHYHYSAPLTLGLCVHLRAQTPEGQGTSVFLDDLIDTWCLSAWAKALRILYISPSHLILVSPRREPLSCLSSPSLLRAQYLVKLHDIGISYHLFWLFPYTFWEQNKRALLHAPLIISFHAPFSGRQASQSSDGFDQSNE